MCIGGYSGMSWKRRNGYLQALSNTTVALPDRLLVDVFMESTYNGGQDFGGCCLWFTLGFRSTLMRYCERARNMAYHLRVPSPYILGERGLMKSISSDHTGYVSGSNLASNTPCASQRRKAYEVGAEVSRPSTAQISNRNTTCVGIGGIFNF